jgi:hypothetical protein
MADCVFDATVVAFANGEIAARKPGNVFDRRLAAIEGAARGDCRIRYNTKLLGEYQSHVQERRNDVIELFFAALTDNAVLVARNTLLRQDYAKARDKCRWPTHDQHLLAAALGGDDPSLFVTEQRHANCRAKILACFGIRIKRLV